MGEPCGINERPILFVIRANALASCDPRQAPSLVISSYFEMPQLANNENLSSATFRPAAIRVRSDDTVAVAIRALAAGERVDVDGVSVSLGGDVPAGHKFALVPHEPGAPVVKYGFPIGVATGPIATGEYVHSHNLKTRLEGLSAYRYERQNPRNDGGPSEFAFDSVTFEGYRRASGRVGTRNEIWILNTVGCVNHAAERIAKITGEKLRGAVDGV